MIFYLCIPIVIYVGYVVVRGYGASIFAQQYAQCTTCEPIPLGVTQGIGIISLLSMYVASYKVKIRFSKVILICAAVYLLLWAMFFRGLRQDVVSALIGFAVCYGLVRGAPFKVRGVHIAPIAMLVAVVEIMGYVRRSIAVKGFDFPDMLRSLLHVANDDHHIGAISPLVTTFANIVYMVKNGVVEYLYGITYAQFIPRSPPAFLYPSRPTDYAWIFPEYGYLAIGGIYELAEAYLNAGLLGVFVFPAILSYLIGLSFYNAINKQTVFSYFIIFSVVALFIRGSFYQVFAFYKLLLTGLILYMIFWLFFEFFSAQRARLR